MKTRIPITKSAQNPIRHNGIHPHTHQVTHVHTTTILPPLRRNPRLIFILRSDWSIGHVITVRRWAKRTHVREQGLSGRLLARDTRFARIYV